MIDFANGPFLEISWSEVVGENSSGSSSIQNAGSNNMKEEPKRSPAELLSAKEHSNCSPLSSSDSDREETVIELKIQPGPNTMGEPSLVSIVLDGNQALVKRFVHACTGKPLLGIDPKPKRTDALFKLWFRIEPNPSNTINLRVVTSADQATVQGRVKSGLEFLREFSSDSSICSRSASMKLFAAKDETISGLELSKEV